MEKCFPVNHTELHSKCNNWDLYRAFPQLILKDTTIQFPWAARYPRDTPRRWWPPDLAAEAQRDCVSCLRLHSRQSQKGHRVATRSSDLSDHQASPIVDLTPWNDLVVSCPLYHDYGHSRELPLSTDHTAMPTPLDHKSSLSYSPPTFPTSSHCKHSVNRRCYPNEWILTSLRIWDHTLLQMFHGCLCLHHTTASH